MDIPKKIPSATPIKKSPRQITPVTLSERQTGGSSTLIDIPNTVLFDNQNKVLNAAAGGNLPALVSAQNDAYYRRGDKTIAEYAKSTSNGTDEAGMIADRKDISTLTIISNLTKNKKRLPWVQKFYLFMLQTVFDGVIDRRSGEIKNTNVPVDLRNMVSCGMYTRLSDAAAAFDENLNTISDFKQATEIYYTQEGQQIIVKDAPFDRTIEVVGAGSIDQYTRYVRLNKDYPWARLGKPFAKVPSWIYQLPALSFRLMLAFTYMLRQHDKMQAIKANHEAELSFTSILPRVGIFPDTVKDLSGRVIKPLKKAIDIINSYSQANGLTIKIRWIGRGSRKQCVQSKFICTFTDGELFNYYRLSANHKKK